MDFLVSLADFIGSTSIPDQVRTVDAVGLFTNPWFMVPFLAFLGYEFYKQSINTLVITAVAIGLWLFSGSPMAQNLLVDGQLQIGKVLPVAGVGILALAIIVYFLFMRSD